MRLLMFRAGSDRRPGALHGESLVDLKALAAAGNETLPDDLLALIECGEDGLTAVRELLKRSDVEQHTHRSQDVEILAPLDPPRGNVVAIGRNYAEHAEESARARNEAVGRPTVFSKAQTTVAGPYDDIPVDTGLTQQVDWEVELGVVIGRGGRDIKESDALNHVFGYTVVNDLSARDIQYGWGGQFYKGKSLDSFCPLGPWIVTADELPDPQNLRLLCRVNGVTKQDGNTRDMLITVAGLIAQLSLGMTLPAGTLIATGTPAGVGQGRTPQEFLHSGDVVESEIEGIGLLRNRIV